ncbi:MAG: DinB family protein [Ignavibacteria bacterium]|nr:DinB family protein [Ignavibacteria bacterium]
MDQERKLLLSLLDEGYSRQTWHGPNLRGSLRGLTLSEAVWRPRPGRHNIWEIAVHAAYWKYAVRRRILGEKRGSFPLEGSNWFRRPTHTSRHAWKEDMDLLREMHLLLVDAVTNIPVSQFRTTPSGSKVSNLRQIYGVAMHDVYHAGQIQLLKRLQRKG